MTVLPPALDMDLLRTLVLVAETGSFTRAGERLRRTQSTVSLQVRRLEDAVGAPLFLRGARRVHPTPAGEMLLPYARQILRLNDEALARLARGDLAGTVRLGTPEDFATTHLPQVLAAFARAHPRVSLEVGCDLTLNLLDRFAAGEFDLVLVKREPQGPGGGVRVWREPLVWAAAAPGLAALAEAGEALPLVVAPHPCVYRKRAMQALDAARRPWRVAYTSPSLAGTQAAVKAGLGLTVLPREMVPPDLTVLDEADGLPALAETEIALLRAPGPGAATVVDRLADHIVRSLERPYPPLETEAAAPM
ncbi:LysR substrate-binding domain-containing protein [Caenispirillum bisanense]|uniref:Transcriptional regulator, LysR family n=1 Tax=Caenispirillum bisanense TaxID=414052 RepID=A0A286H0X8_9PROT|nr:LysR substrate-binding domain-containing protein [Caenispirillum bisanense]SOE01372.1 transcriptional regulator, LysR family [Caenispirillum bisanense]